MWRSGAVQDMTDLTTPHAIANAALMRLSTAGLQPTPENYARVYHEVAGSTAPDGTDALARELMLARDRVTEAERQVLSLGEKLEAVRSQARQDPLTRALNRHGLEEKLRHELASAARRGGALTLALMDLDNFKHLNDTYGHLAGDAALAHIAEVIRRTIRPTDSVARYGGEEFLVILPDAGLPQAALVLKRLQSRLASQVCDYRGEALRFTFSAGIAAYVPGDTAEEVLARADKALYRAKQAGKNCVVAEQAA